MSTITEVLGTDSWNEGRVKFNTSIDNINDDLIADIAALAAHKAGNDHSSTYAALSHTHTGVYAESDEVVALTGDQEIAGEKTFKSDPVVEKATPAFVLHNAGGTNVARLISITDTTLALQVYDSGTASFKTQLLMDVTTGKLSNATGGELVDKTYVQARVRSGFFFIPLQRYMATPAAATTYPVQDASGQTLITPVPNGATLKKLSVQWYIGSTTEIETEDVSVGFSESGYRWITVDCVIAGDDRYLNIKVYGWRIVTAVPTSTLIVDRQVAKDDGFVGTAMRIALGLEFSI